MSSEQAITNRYLRDRARYHALRMLKRRHEAEYARIYRETLDEYGVVPLNEIHLMKGEKFDQRKEIP